MKSVYFHQKIDNLIMCGLKLSLNTLFILWLYSKLMSLSWKICLF